MRVFIKTLLLAGSLFTMAGCSTAGVPPSKKLTGFKVIYLHGFGGKREDPYFLKAMRTFHEETNISFELENRNWDSVKIDFGNIKNIGLQWRRAVENAEAEAKIFANDLKKLEDEGTSYYLTAYSLGAKVVLDALKARKTPLTHCKGIYFMGAAVPRDYEITRDALPKGLSIVNYYSPKHDTVLDISYRTSEGKIAGGQVGFENTEVFTNYRCTCTHVYKGVGVHSDWSQMAEPIGYLILQNEQVEVPGKTEPNIYFRVGDGKQLWNNIIRFDKVSVKSIEQSVLIQQHKLDKHYRAVAMVTPKAKRYRIAWGNNLHAILKAFSLFKKQP